MAGMSEEERGFRMLMEKLEGQYKLLSEQMTGFDQRLDRELQQLRGAVMTKLDDIATGIAGLVQELREHKQSHRAMGA